MASKLEIINLGLSRISQRNIASLTEGSVQSNVANAAWLPCLRECLRGDWPFATVVEAIALVAPTYTPFRYSYAYTYPANAIAVWKLYNEGTVDTDKGEDFRLLYVPSLAKKIIVTNCVDAYSEYTYLVTDTTLYDDNFITVLSYRLAADFAMPLNADPEQAKNLMMIFNNQMSEASRIASYEGNINNGESRTGIIDARSDGNTISTSVGGQVFDEFNRGL